MFKSPIDWLKELIKELIHDFANMAFDWIELFMLKPTDFSEYTSINFVYQLVFSIASSLCIVFVTWSLLQIIFNNMAGVQSRSMAEVLSKAGLSFVLAAAAPWLLNDVLLKLNNAIVQIFLDKGLDTDMLEAFATINNSSGLAIFLMAFVIIILFVLLGVQYIQRLGEYIVLLVTSPIAAQSIITENFDIWSVWWREALSVIFSQAYQVALLWLVLNMLTGTEKLSEYVFAICLMVMILKGPKYLRNVLYSSGAGKMAVGLAGGVSKASMYKFAASRIVGK